MQIFALTAMDSAAGASRLVPEGERGLEKYLVGLSMQTVSLISSTVMGMGFPR